MKTRTGKIARLPRLIRNELNQRLDDGVEGKKLVRWLNRLPEMRQVLGEYFEGKPVTEQNLSDWKAGGFAEWVGRQEFLAQARELAEEAEDLREVSQGNRVSLAEHLSTVLAMRYAKVLKEWQGEANEAVTKQLRLLHGLSHDVSRLARVGLERQRVELRREKSQGELVDLFSDWVAIPAVREAVCEDYISLEDRKRVLCRIYNRPYEEVQGPKSEVQRKKRQGNKRQGNGGKARGCKERALQKDHPSPSIPLPVEGRGRTDASAFRGEVLQTTRGRKRWLKDPTTCDARGRVPYQTAAAVKAADQAAGQKRMDEDTARGYIRRHPDWRKKRQGNERQGNGGRARGCGEHALQKDHPSPSIPLPVEGRGKSDASVFAGEVLGKKCEGNREQSCPIVPRAIEAVVARLNRGEEGDLPEDEQEKAESGKAESENGDCADWEREDEVILKEAAEAHRRREAARMAEDEKRLAEENRLWRVKAGFEEPTEEMSKIQGPESKA